MRRVLVAVLLCLALLTTGARLSAYPTVAAELSQNQQVTVCVTRTGTKYHRCTCSYLRQSSTSMTLAAAKKAGYTPCSRCKPPT